MRKRGRPSAPHRCMQRPRYAGKQDAGSHRQQSHGHTSGQIASFIEATVDLFFFGEGGDKSDSWYQITLPHWFYQRACPTELASCGGEPTILMTMMRRPSIQAGAGTPATAGQPAERGRQRSRAAESDHHLVEPSGGSCNRTVSDEAEAEATHRKLSRKADFTLTYTFFNECQMRFGCQACEDALQRGLQVKGNRYSGKGKLPACFAYRTVPLSKHTTQAIKRHTSSRFHREQGAKMVEEAQKNDDPVWDNHAYLTLAIKSHAKSTFHLRALALGQDRAGRSRSPAGPQAVRGGGRGGRSHPDMEVDPPRSAVVTGLSDPSGPAGPRDAHLCHARAPSQRVAMRARALEMHHKRYLEDEKLRIQVEAARRLLSDSLECQMKISEVQGRKEDIGAAIFSRLVHPHIFQGG